MTRDGTIFYHLLPFVEYETVYRANNLNATVKIYNSPRDPSNRGVSNLTSIASNFAAFGRESRNLADVTRKREASNVICWMERYAVAGNNEHRWPDAADGATWLLGGEAGFEANFVPQDASNTSAHAMGPGGLIVGFADGSVKMLKPTTNQETFRWACDPDRDAPQPPDWKASQLTPRREQSGRSSGLELLLPGLVVAVLLGFLVILWRRGRKSDQHPQQGG